ncbi:MAG: DUF2061 domain-containing protein [Alphaproteobacteria bacterium]|nr:DUF2061 domain-containing protein [Alphaproteobacteria bacterium]
MSDIIVKNANSNPRRSIAKAISWRILGSIDTAVLGYLFTGSFKIAGSIASTEILTKVVLYYFHERAWAHSRFGLKKINLAADAK